MGHRASPGRPVKTESLGTRLAMLSGRTECVPPRKPPFTPSLGLPTQPHSRRLAVWGRGGLRTPASGVLPLPWDRPIGPPNVRLPPMIMLCLGSLPARISGRGDRAPPRRLPRRHLRPFPARPSVPGPPPPEGRAPHARWEGLRLTEARVLLATGSSSTHPVGIRYLGIPPAVTGGRTECAPRENRPSRAFRVSHPEALSGGLAPWRS